MKNIVLLLLVVVICGNGHAAQVCIPELLQNCTNPDNNVKVILVDNQVPKENCSSIRINNTIYIYDRLNITKVSITLVNKNMDCNSDSMKQLNKILNLTTEEVIFIHVADVFFRIVFVNLTNLINKAAFFPPNFDQKLKNANLVLYPNNNDLYSYGIVCLNGGTLNNTYKGAGYRCICPKYSIAFGPRCEYIDRVLNSSIYYFNIFRHSDIINLTFSLFSNGIKDSQSLLTIKNSLFQKVAEVGVSESVIYLRTADKSKDFVMSIDKQEWHEFYVDVSKKGISLRVSMLSLNLTFTTPIRETFRSHYLILKEDNLSKYSICIRSLKSNEQIIDLNNGDGYESCCLDRCIQCKQNEDCACSPFMSQGNTKCYCKIGYESKSEPSCKLSSLKNGQIPVSSEVFFNQTEKLSRMDLLFRTLSVNGTIVTLIPSSRPFTTISAIINNTNLILNVDNRNIRQINYNVSDGVYHSITLNVKSYSLEMILDNNDNYSLAVSNWATNFSSSIIYSSLKLGPLYKPFNSTVNIFSTCFSAIRINGISDKQYDIDIISNNNVVQGCDTGPRCFGIKNISCPENQICKDNEWQNTKCVCIEKFEFRDSVCIYNECLKNPCKNNGQCFYNKFNYSCTCNVGYYGYTCEVGPVFTTSLWWIAILVVLLLLLILIIVLLIYCCCYNKRKVPPESGIAKIQENTVIYNEQAGECDYNGPPINYNLMKDVLYNKQNLPKVTINVAQIYPILQINNKKFDVDHIDNDLALDHPLEYGFEGYNSDYESISSLGSASTNSQLNISPLENTNKHFHQLNSLYK